MEKTQTRNFEQLEISIASPKEIRSWAERYLPTGEIIGEVTSWETVNYKTLKPEPNGLFCQKIFGPVVDFTCACGKKAGKLNPIVTIQNKVWPTQGFCPKCGVERTTSQVRRYRMGYIHLKQPVAHTLYASQKPSPLTLSLNWTNKKFQAVLYGTEFSHISSNFKNLGLKTSNLNLRKFRTFNVKDKVFDLNSPIYQKKVPKLFQNKIKTKHTIFQKLYSKKGITFNNFLYGVSHDMTWRQVEDFQYFLIYLWEQSVFSDGVIPYYFELKDTKRYDRHISTQNSYYPITTGALVFQKLMSYYDLVGLQRQVTLDLKEVKLTLKYLLEFNSSDMKLQIEISRYKQLEKKLLRRLMYFRDFYKAKIRPEWMIITYLPVLPPGLRPITSIRGELVVSDLNSLYRKVLTRNRRLSNTTKFNIFDTALSGSWASWCYNLRQVQESVDSLLKTGKVESNKTTKSLLDALKGKKGRFRQHLLGKRVDYSGRSVIVVGPELKIYQCGLPKKMAIELFQPFLIQQLRNRGIAFTTTGAKAIILEQKPIIWSLLHEILQSHPILLNRAPTLHRLGIQAFLPKLVDGKAILLHPLVCPAFNADFDGDQMAVHIPLSPAARAEAFNLLLASNHLLSPSSGNPLLLPTQDMVLGCYYLTIPKEKSVFGASTNKNVKKLYVKKVDQNYYSNIDEILEDYHTQKINLQSPIWLFWNKRVQNNEHRRVKPLELRIRNQGNLEIFYTDKYKIQRKKQESRLNANNECYIRTTPGRILFNQLLA